MTQTTQALLILINEVCNIQEDLKCPTTLWVNNATGVMTIAIGFPNETRIDYENCLYYKTLFYSYDYADDKFLQSVPTILMELKSLKIHNLIPTINN